MKNTYDLRRFAFGVVWITGLLWLLSTMAWATSPPGSPPGRFGAPKALSIGNRVFQDYNRNGIQDAIDPGVSNVPVYLYESGVLRGSTTSGTNGAYTFDNSNVTNGLKSSTAYEVEDDSNIISDPEKEEA